MKMFVVVAFASFAFAAGQFEFLRNKYNVNKNGVSNQRLRQQRTFCNLNSISTEQELKYIAEFHALDTDHSGFLDAKDLGQSDTKIEGLLKQYQSHMPRDMEVVNNRPRDESRGCCYGRSLSEITRGALQYLQNLGFTSPQKHENRIDAALVQHVLAMLLKSGKTKINECQFATAMYYAEKSAFLKRTSTERRNNIVLVHG